MYPLLGVWPTTQAYAPTGNQTSNLFICRPSLNPLSHTSQGTHSVLFILLMASVAVQITFYFDVVPLVYFFTYFPCLMWYIRKKYCYKKCPTFLLPMFSSNIFVLPSLIFKLLIHFEFIHVYHVRMWPSFIFLQVSVQFSQHHLSNIQSLSHCMSFLPSSNIN